MRQRILSLSLLVIVAVLVASEPNWSFEIEDITFENLTPDIVEINIARKRLSRGHYGISGSFNLKQDLTDDLLVKVDVFRSATGSKNYIRSPLHIPECPLSSFLNSHYKNLIMETLKSCSVNSPQFEDTMNMPFTQREMILNDCVLSMENLPTHMAPGYYRLEFIYRQQANGSVVFYATIEKN